MNSYKTLHDATVQTETVGLHFLCDSVDVFDDFPFSVAELVHPDGAVDLYVELVVLDGFWAGMGAELVTDDFGPSCEDLCLLEVFAEVCGGLEGTEDVPDAGGLGFGACLGFGEGLSFLGFSSGTIFRVQGCRLLCGIVRSRCRWLRGVVLELLW